MTADQDLVTLAEILIAERRIRGIVLRTPLLSFGPPDPVDPAGRARVLLKPESLQPIGAFKLRGAYNAIASLDRAARAAGVVAHSSGNHAQGVARAARLLGVRTVIVMPADAPAIKRERVLADGARLVLVGPSSEERATRASELARERGLTLISSHDDRAVIAGQGTVGLEIVEQVRVLAGAPTRGDERPAGLDRALTVLVPVGGGGLAAGTAAAVKSLDPGASVIGVVPALAAHARESLVAGRIVRWPAEVVGRTIADGQRLTALGELPFAHLARQLDSIVVVEELEIVRAMAVAVRDARLVLEPSGATALAAWLFHRHEIDAPGRVVIVLTGGNVDPVHFRQWIAAGEAASRARSAGEPAASRGT